ncbi:MAG TPA: CocE/NonD family hydrolase [Candidatus Thermoplasmatota archaeon]|nr:CocE/NonD family hydrolase [Candidatus Thermoplasmatota archaeon]
MRCRLAVVAVLLLGAGLAGCASKPDGTEPGADGQAFTPGVHPWPNAPGVDWPVGLAGPFQLASVTNVKIPGFDGVRLDGWVLRPAVPEGVKVPVVLWSAPYFGLNNQAGNDPAGWDNSGASEAVPVNLLVEQGYAVAIVNLRGSGNSQGCYELFGSKDWKDVAAMVEWLGAQDWSNGRVGMMGLSYHGTTPWMAAVEAPPHLKTIITAGQVSQLYTFFHTPQGAHLTIGPAFTTLLNALDTAPPLLADPQDIAEGFPPSAPSRVCPELVGVATEGYKTAYTDLRDEAFWEDRNILAHYGSIQTSVFLTMGLLDYHGSGHHMQDDFAWANLPPGTPARMLEGQWEHMFPNFGKNYVETGRDWNATFLPWLDFWLKGIGASAPGLGVVEYQDSDNGWHESTAWPPAESEPRALYLDGGSLGAEAGQGSRSFLPRSQSEYYDGLCDPQAPGLPQSLLYETEPFDAETLLAGNNYALLDVESNLPGGQLAVFLIAIEEGGLGCGALGEGGGGTRFLAMGAADLRHYAGNYIGTDFPTGTPTEVRIDINNFAEVLHVGERLAVVIAYGDATMDGPNDYWPELTIHEGKSHVVVPLRSGVLDAADPWPQYPPRPFDPMGGDP